ncbi:MAG TPA: YIP1 family protein, partial [Holophagaceae bacterium]
MNDGSPSLYGDQPQTPRPKAPGLMEQIVGVFTEPGALFERLNQSPSWGWAVGLLTGLSVVMTVAWGLKVDVDEMMRPILERNPKIDSAQIDTIIEMQKKFMLPFGVLGALFGTILIVLIIAFLFWLVGRFQAEQEKPSFLQALSATAVPGLVRIPSLLLITLICLVKPIGGLTPEKIAPTSLGYFIQVGNLKLQAMLYSLDLFFLANLALGYLALRKTMRMKTAGALLCTFVIVLLTVGGRALGA